MGFFNLSDAMTLGLVEGAQDTLSSIRKKDEEDYKLAKKQAENASIVAGKVTAKYKEQEKAYEVTGQNLLNNVAFQKSIDKLKTKYPDEFSGVSDLQIATRFGKSYLIHNSKDGNDSPNKYASRAALTINQQIINKSIDPNLLAIKDVEKPIDIQTKELTTMEKMTPKGRQMQMEQSLRPSGKSGEFFDTAMKGGTPTVPINQTEPLVGPAKPRLIGSQIKDSSNAIVNELTGSTITMEGENIIYPNTNTFDKKIVTKGQAQQLNAQLSTIDREFKGFIRNFSSIIDVDDPATLNDAAKVFKEIAVDKTTFAVDTNKLRNLDQNTVLRMMDKLKEAPKQQSKTPDGPPTDTSNKGKLVATENVPNEARQRFEKNREAGGNTVVMDGKTYTFIERPNKTLEVYVK